MHILIVDDNKAFSQNLSRVLSKQNKVECIHDFHTAVSRLEYIEYDAICLDIHITDDKADGLELCALARKLSPNALIIFLTGKEITSSLVTKIVEAGGDSFLEKNSSAENLLKRIDRLKEQKLEHKKQTSKAFTHPIYSKITLDKSLFTLAIDGITHDIGPTAFSLLTYLLEHPNMYHHVSKLMRFASEYASGSQEAIKVHIHHIRKAIAPYDTYLQNRWGGWYGFIIDEEESS